MTIKPVLPSATIAPCSYSGNMHNFVIIIHEGLPGNLRLEDLYAWAERIQSVCREQEVHLPLGNSVEITPQRGETQVLLRVSCDYHSVRHVLNVLQRLLNTILLQEFRELTSSVTPA